MATIKEYLEQVRASQGVPTFTNIGGENPLLQPQGGQPGAHLIQEANQPMMGPGGMVSRPEPAAMPTAQPGAGRSQDPWELAQDATKKMMPEIWETVFPGMTPGATLDDAQMKMWQKAVMSTRNAMVDRYKYQQDQISKKENLQYKRDQAAVKAEDRLTTKERANLLKDYVKEHNKIANDTLHPQSQQMQAIPEMDYALGKLKELEAGLGKKAIPAQDPGQGPGQQGGPVVPGAPQPGAVPGQGTIGAEPGVTRMDSNVPMLYQTLAEGVGMGDVTQAPTISEFQAQVQRLKAQYGNTPESNVQIRAELKQLFPMINLP